MIILMLIPDRIRKGRVVSRRALLGLFALASMAVLPIAGAVAAVNCTVSAGPGKEPITCSARTMDLDYKTKTNLMHLRGDVKIAQGDLSVMADAADAVMEGNSRNSHWVFTGNVHVRAEKQGDLRADRATVEITDGALASADVTGSPAQFEQTRAMSGRLARGHAATINYDVAAGKVKLSGDALLTDEHNENDMSGPTITYNIRDRHVEGDSSGTGGRIDMTITPKTITGKGARDSSAPPGKP
jgi:lipopolysaccharide transport protein LptA